MPNAAGTGSISRTDAGTQSPVADTFERRIRALGVLPIVAVPGADAALRLVEIFLAAGLPAIEITFRTAAAPDAVRAVRSAFPGLLLGAGTIIATDQADAALDAGADFLVAPGTNPRVVAHVLARGGRMVPGVATASEIELNLERGIELLKLYPSITVGGVDFIRAVRGPFPAVEFLPSGGVTGETARSFLEQPNVAAVGGTWIAPLDAVVAGDWSSIERRAVAAGELVRELRSGVR